MRKLVVTSLIVLAGLAPGVACSGGVGAGESGGTTGGGGKTQDVGAARESSQGGGTAASRSAIGSVTSVAAVPQVGPKIVQTASLTVSVPSERFDEAVDEARSVAVGLGGFVVSSSAVQGGFERLVRGTLVLRVPARSYADAMKALAALGRVEGRRESGQDVSQEYVDLGARARQLEAVESQLLELLDRANTVGAALAVQRQLSEVQLDLERARGRLQYLEDQVAFATVSLDLHERLASPAKSGDDGFGILQAWSKAAHGFLAVVGWTFVVLATAAPLLILLLLAVFLGLRLRKRLAHA